MTPYANKVFSFLCWYCITVAFITLLHGTKYKGFYIETPVLSILVGSTAVAAIGLVGIVVRGLFGVKS